MNAYAKNFQAYKNASVNTTDQGTLILMLYDGTIKFLNISLEKLKVKDFEGAHKSITRAKNIISELLGSLDIERSGEIGENLQKLYAFMYDRLIDANVNKNSTYISEVIELMTELREGWRQVNQQKKQIKNPFPTKGSSKSLSIKG